jgi:CRISPR/Cas system-associated exonuclease Cas4 (RecB family)
MPIKEIINDSDWPQPLVDFVLANERTDDGRLHVTALNACLRSMVLKFNEPYVVYTSKLYPMMRGILFHEGIAKMLKALDQPHLVIEKNVRRERGGVIISGTCDMIDTKARTITDWKLPLRAASKIWPAYVAQLNVYSWLAEAEYKIDSIHLGVFDPYRLKMVEIDKWKPENVEQYLDSRLTVLKGHSLPFPEGMGWESFHCGNCLVAESCQSKEDYADYV